MAIGHRRGWVIAASIAGLVTAGIYFAGPWALKTWAVSTLRDSLGQPVAMAHLGFNPFTATASLKGLTIGGGRTPIIHVDEGNIVFRWSTLWQSGIHVDQIDLLGPHLHLVQTPEGHLDIAQLGGSSSGSSLSLAIESITTHQGRIDWVDQNQSSQASLSVTDLDLSLTGYNSQQSSPMQGQATGTLEGGQLEAEGRFGISPFTGDLQLEGNQVGLVLINPWLERMSSVQVEKGTLSGQGRLAFGQAVQDQVQWQGDLKAEALVLLNGQRQSVFSTQQADFEGVDLLTGHHLSAESLQLASPQLMAVIDEQGSFNLTSMPSRQSGKGQEDSRQQGNAQQNASGKDERSDDGMALALGRLEINNGTFHFQDRHMSPAVSLDIESLNGHMQDFDTRRDALAGFSLEGLESEQTPVAIEGQFNAGAASGDMHMTVERLPLERFAPYIQRFGGYRIEAGNADLDLRYRLSNQHLNANNHVVLRHLDLGEEVPESHTSLPLKKLIGVLKSDDGVINLDIPINASIDGAGVDVSRVIWQVLGETLENLVTSPLDTLSAMISSDDESGEQEDQQGRAYDEGPLSAVATEPQGEP